jgi:lupus La protein
MSDTQPAAEAVSNNPAKSVEDKDVDAAMTDVKTKEVSVEVSKSEATDTTHAGDKEAANGDSTDIKGEESTNAREDNYRRDWKNGGRHGKDYHHKSDRNGYRGNRYSGRNNKSRDNEFENLAESKDPVEIRAQVEFYFSPQNLREDEHLFMQLGGPKNHPVSLKHIADFKRMRHFKPYSAIVEALRDSEDVIVVDDGEYSGTGKEAIKRKEPLICPSHPDDEQHPPSIEDLFYRNKKASLNKMEASIYVKGFAEDGQEVGQIALEEFFKPYGAIMVRKRRDWDNGNGRWKGSVFVEFDSQDAQQQYLALDPKPKFQDRDLLIMSKRDYNEMKCREKGITPAHLRDEDSRSSRNTNGGGRGSHNGGRGRGHGRGRGGSRGRGGARGGTDRFGRDRERRNTRRDRSRSANSVDSDDWNKRRDRDNNKHRKSGREARKSPERDADGVPIIKDTRTEEEKAASKKRKAEDAAPEEAVKKSKIEIKEDE